MKSKIKFSMIIPVKEINQYIIENIPKLLNLNYPKNKYEIIIYPDKDNGKLSTKDKRLRIIPTSHISPGRKRDLALKHAKGEFIVFIDDDAYPEKNYLKLAEQTLTSNPNIKVLTGPNLTPPESNIWQKVSGGIFANFFATGPARFRYKKTKKQFVDDAPSCNLFIEKKLFKKLGGFDSKFWPGEDTKLCNDVLEAGEKILYIPDLFVYHHRRNSPFGHLKQVWSYSVHRGYFAKTIKGNSSKFKYFLPTFAILFGSLFLLFSLLFTSIFYLFIGLICIYSLLVIVDSYHLKDLKVILLTYIGVILTTITYGIGLMVGLTRKNLKSKLR